MNSWAGSLCHFILLSKQGRVLFDDLRTMKTEVPAYKRIVLKLSGEALRERGARDNISPAVVREIAERIREVRDLGVQVSVVIGGGNIWRGLSAADRGMDRTTADYMGMLATVINALALRSTLAEIRADVILKATKVDGIYDRDPKTDANAHRYEQITFTEALTKRLRIMDSTAFSLCMDNKIPIVVFDMNKPSNIRDAVWGRKVGTLVCDEPQPK